MSLRSLPPISWGDAPFQHSISCATVGAVFDTSNTRPSFTTMGVGPSPISIRPTSTASRQSSGRGNMLVLMTLSLEFDLQHIADVIRGDPRAFLGRPPGRGVQLDIEMTAPVDGFQIGHDGGEVHAALTHGIEIGIIHHVAGRQGYIPGTALV